MRVERSLKHARESPDAQLRRVVSCYRDRWIKGRTNGKHYRLLIQGLRHRQASPHIASREGYARENSQD